MNVRQLECFLAVAEALHFGRAAARLNMAQPPLSRHIMNLEADLGVRLFVRTSRNVQLTEVGAVLLAEARPLIQGIGALPDLVHRLQSGRVGQLRIGAVGPAMDGRLPEIIRAFSKRNPDIEFQVSIAGTAAQIEDIRRDRLHVGFVRPYLHDTADLNSCVVQSDPYALAVPTSHILARKTRVSLTDLDGENLIFFPRITHPDLYDAILGLLHEAGARVRVTQESDSKSMMIAMVAAGLGVGLIPQSSARSGRDGVRFVPIAATLPAVEIHALWRKDNGSELLGNFVAALDIYSRAQRERGLKASESHK